MSINVLFAGIAVADFEASLAWYGRLFGRPADIVVNADEVMWRIAESAWLYIVRDPRHAGGGLVALAVDDLEQAVAGIEERGIPSPAIETISDAGRKVAVKDPDDNTIAFIQVEPSEN